MLASEDRQTYAMHLTQTSGNLALLSHAKVDWRSSLGWTLDWLIAIRGLSPLHLLSAFSLSTSIQRGVTGPRGPPTHLQLDHHHPEGQEDGGGWRVRGCQGHLRRLPAEQLPEEADSDVQIGRPGESMQQV